MSVIVTTTKNNICYMFFIFLCFPERRPTSPHILQLHETKNYSFELLNIILLNVIFVRPRWRQVLRGLWQLLGLNPHCDLPAEFSWTICIREKMHIDN